MEKISFKIENKTGFWNTIRLFANQCMYIFLALTFDFSPVPTKLKISAK